MTLLLDDLDVSMQLQEFWTKFDDPTYQGLSRIIKGCQGLSEAIRGEAAFGRGEAAFGWRFGARAIRSQQQLVAASSQ